MNLWLFWEISWCCFLQFWKVQRPGDKKNLAQVSTPISPCVSKGCLFSGVKLLHLRSTSHSFQVTLFFLSPKHLLQIPKLLPDVQNSQMIHWSSPLCRYWLKGRGKRGKKREKRKTWRPKVSSQKIHLFCWLNSCRMSCGSSCLIVIRASVRLWAHSISPY